MAFSPMSKHFDSKIPLDSLVGSFLGSRHGKNILNFYYLFSDASFTRFREIQGVRIAVSVRFVQVKNVEAKEIVLCCSSRILL